MNSSPDLQLDWCSDEAAKYAIMRWHYSRITPKGKNVYIGVWEKGAFIGAVVFGSGGGSSTHGGRFGLRQSFDVAELVRVALAPHEAPVSRIVSIAVRMVKRHCPGLKMLISFADPAHGHVGGIYQALNWLYIGEASSVPVWRDAAGVDHHDRTVNTSGWKVHFGKNVPCLKKGDLTRIERPAKHIYTYPLRAKMRPVLEGMAQPYPKRQNDRSDDLPAHQTGEGGSIPTLALQSS